MRLCLPVQQVWVQFLAQELRFHMPPGGGKTKSKPEAML